MRNLKLVKFGTDKPEYYKDILIHAHEGLHSQAMELLKRYLPFPASILDVAAGKGAFSLRLLDHGYRVEACDINPDWFKPQGIEIKKVDLNQDLKSHFDKQYDGLVALEIMEHLHNPWKFIGECKALVKKGGILVLTVPNIASFYARGSFLRTGNLFQFSNEESHINPLTSRELQMIFKQNDLEVIYKGIGGTLPLFHFSDKKVISLYAIWRNIILPFLYVFMKGDKKGWNLTFVLRVK